MDRQFLLFGAFVLLLSGSISGQWLEKGRLKSWNTSSVSRISGYGDFIYLTDIRVARNPGFDRVVFEFKGGLPSYRVQFADKLEMYGPDDEPVKLRGSHFVSINLQGLPYPEDSNLKDVIVPVTPSGMRSFVEMRETEWFEGVRFYLVGLRSRPQFRVQELSNPYRLVIDFKR